MNALDAKKITEDSPNNRLNEYLKEIEKNAYKGFSKIWIHDRHLTPIDLAYIKLELLKLGYSINSLTWQENDITEVTW